MSRTVDKSNLPELEFEDIDNVFALREKLMNFSRNNTAPRHIAALVEYQSFVKVSNTMGFDCEWVLKLCKAMYDHHPVIVEALIAN